MCFHLLKPRRAGVLPRGAKCIQFLRADMHCTQMKGLAQNLTNKESPNYLYPQRRMNFKDGSTMQWLFLQSGPPADYKGSPRPWP